MIRRGKHGTNWYYPGDFTGERARSTAPDGDGVDLRLGQLLDPPINASHRYLSPAAQRQAAKRLLAILRRLDSVAFAISST